MYVATPLFLCNLISNDLQADHLERLSKRTATERAGAAREAIAPGRERVLWHFLCYLLCYAFLNVDGQCAFCGMHTCMRTADQIMVHELDKANEAPVNGLRAQVQQHLRDIGLRFFSFFGPRTVTTCSVMWLTLYRIKKI